MMQLMLSMQVCGSIGNWMCSVLSVYMCMNKLKQFLSSETITREALKSFRFMAQTPSCAGMCRCGIMGEVQTYLIDLTSVPETSDAANSMKKLKQFLSSETISRADLAKTCPKIFRARCKPASLLYVPAGYFVVEAATQGPLCFGVMQSLFLNSDKEAYEHAIKINKADLRDVKVMEDLLAKCFS